MSDYILTREQLENIIFPYLDFSLKDLELYTAKDRVGFVWKLPEDTNGLFFYARMQDMVYTNIKLTKHISMMFSVSPTSSTEVIRKWFVNKYLNSPPRGFFSPSEDKYFNVGTKV